MSFKSDIQFCSECGAILPLPGLEDVVTCRVCKYQIDATEFDGVEMKSTIVFNVQKKIDQPKDNEQEQYSLPTVDQNCPKCGNEGMTYATRQTRSADEGQTVFYSCPKCGHQEQEYS